MGTGDLVDLSVKRDDSMQLDIRGKVKERKLAYAHTLLPLFEALVNSIQAIEEGSATQPGIIHINLVRSPQRELGLDGQTSMPPVLDITVRDNGIGFTNGNFESFNFAHSTYKEKKGGKGIGRFVWLRAFRKVEIESQFVEESKWYQRKFSFELTRNGIENHVLKEVTGPVERFTEVRLRGLREEYQKWCNTYAEDISIKIIEHCFVYFLRADCPRFILHDGDEEIVVNDFLALHTRDHVRSGDLKVGRENFHVDMMRLYGKKMDNKIHYCAHAREVFSEKLSHEIPELDSYIEEDGDERFTISVYVSGQYLDINVNEDRTAVRFAKHDDGTLYPDEVSQEDLRRKVAEFVRAQLNTYLESLFEAKIERVRQFVQKNPRYRQLLKYKKDEISRVPSYLPDDKLELELFKIQQKLDLEVKSEAEEILKFIEDPEDKDEFQNRFADLYDKIIEVGNSKLSEYVIHRKLVLELLEKHIKRSDTGKFSKETAIHKLVFPLKYLSDEIGFNDHNLWIIDERLAYHRYLASDKKFKQIKLIDSQSADRPDIIVFNRPFAFTSGDKPYSSIVLIEFKRPMRDDYSEKENPISQVIRYAGELSANEGTDKDDRTFDIRSNTPIYGYIICDLTKNLRKFAKDAGFKPLPDNDGFFNFNDNYNLYIEIMSFDKLLRDSKQRNKALFEMLNLPSS